MSSFIDYYKLYATHVHYNCNATHTRFCTNTAMLNISCFLACFCLVVALLIFAVTRKTSNKQKLIIIIFCKTNYIRQRNGSIFRHLTIFIITLSSYFYYHFTRTTEWIVMMINSPIFYK